MSTTVETATEALPRFGRLVMGAAITQALHVAATLGLADRIAEQPQRADELAEAVGANADALYRLLRVLAAEGVFAEREDGAFEMTDLAQFMRAEAFAATALHWGANWHYAAWGGLLHSVRTGGPAFEDVHGVDHFTYLEREPEAMRVFQASMTATSVFPDAGVLQAYDFTGIKRLVDVGGGHGRLLAGILTRHPEMQGVLFEHPKVLGPATKHLAGAGVLDRCELVGGDFFESVPAGADAYLLTRVLHDWDDDQAAAILAAVRSAIPDDGRLLTVESVIPPGNGPFLGKIIDLGMLCLFGGRERTAEQYAALYERSGFTLDAVIPTFTPLSVVEGRPARN
jgi:hypothetical protein